MTDTTIDTLNCLKRPLRYLMGLLYISAGVTHFRAPRIYARIVPPQFPCPVGLVYLSGAAEIVLGTGVLFQRTRRHSAWGLIALLVAVFPANVYMATSGMAAEMVPERARSVAQLVAWIRLPLQAVLIRWAWWYTQQTPEVFTTPHSCDGEPRTPVGPRSYLN